MPTEQPITDFSARCQTIAALQILGYMAADHQILEDLDKLFEDHALAARNLKRDRIVAWLQDQYMNHAGLYPALKRSAFQWIADQLMAGADEEKPNGD